MSGLFNLKGLNKNLKKYVYLKELKPESAYILSGILRQGEMPRGEAVRITGMKERSGRNVLAELLKDGIIGSDGVKGPVSLRFDTGSSRVLFPRLFEDFTLDDDDGAG